MTPTREEVLAQVIELVPTVAEGGAHLSEQAEITQDTRILGDLDWSSMEVVILANSMQERFEQTFPFIEWFQSLAREGRQDLTIREWVDFVYSHLEGQSSPAQQA